jgi:hypothetical protein
MRGLVTGLIFALIAFPPQRAADYALTPKDEARVRESFASQRFSTPSQAAYAASLRYEGVALTAEVGAKIYVDIVQDSPVYSYGAPIYGEADDENAEEIIEYDPRSSDGHFFLIGIWHEHPASDSWFSLYGHYAQVSSTHQAVWTTIGHELFVQYWDGTRPMPQWTSAVPAIPPILGG